MSAQESILDQAKAWMAAYGDDLAAGDRDAIVARYHPEGAWFGMNAAKAFRSLPDIRARYASVWQPPTEFRWIGLAYEVAGPDAVVATGQFHWGIEGGSRTYSYTGLLLRLDGTFRIRIEEESFVLN
ncbi:hypothetical protein A6F68_00008 [Tsuneonella dongtanensis]|uniref:SnoaL-like domain-containing protein n=1 Tax=Tsuneonella dongtanensis TaxID=692370 RepID=A0A1B2A8Y7_9SPHN|nr:nuclear transport factor 2 family protein [Tsuneonella dongtanensis]ANY18544.1 hypothetical protein A6F68_00008 [Tsuneonella dongtanensis]